MAARLRNHRRQRGRAILRSRPSYTPDELLTATLAAPLLWPGRTTRLSRDSLVDYMNRSVSPEIAVSELYHENSKLTREQLPDLMQTMVDVSELRQEFMRRRATRAMTPNHAIDSWWSLARDVFIDSPELFYAVELRIVAAGMMFAYEPGAGMSAISDLPPQRLEGLLEAVCLLDSTTNAEAPRKPPPAAVFILLGSFGRNEILLGARGYRRTLLETGQLTEGITRAARRAGRSVIVRFEFADRDLDRIMEVDGVEQGALAVIDVY